MAHLIQERGSKNFFLRNAVAFPLVWLMILPIGIADIFLEIYHQIAFPILGIPRVKRSRYIRISDREKLPYLTLLEKFACAYCGYVNGWLHYASIIGGRTENYFCAIAHLETKGYVPSEHERSFVRYGDEAALMRRYAKHEIKNERLFD